MVLRSRLTSERDKLRKQTDRAALLDFCFFDSMFIGSGWDLLCCACCASNLYIYDWTKDFQPCDDDFTAPKDPSPSL